jgi:hypothetical protein
MEGSFTTGKQLELQQKKAWANALKKLGLKNKTEVLFIDYGKEEKEKNIDDYNLSFIQEEKQKIVFYFLKEFEKYLYGPIFVDDSYNDQNKKYKWRETIQEEFKENKDILNFFDSNRSRVNKFASLFGFLQDEKAVVSFFKEDEQGKVKKQEYENIIKNIPIELIKKEEDEKHNLVYCDLKKEEKAKIILAFSKVLKEVIAFFEKKK